MKTNNKLPAYFEEFLDERFGHLGHKVDDLKTEVLAVKKQVMITNGRVTKNEKKIMYLAMAIIFGSFFWIQESRNVVIGLLRAAIGF